MKIAFRFENGSSECILTPENARDKNYIDLCIDGRSEIKLKPTTSDGIILLFVAKDEIPKPKPKPIIIPCAICSGCGKSFDTPEELKLHEEFKCVRGL